jgi:xanthine dehydrogenase small subunit
MAATPKRGVACEAALIGNSWDLATVMTMLSVVQEDYQPISDHRATKEYRLQVAGNLFQRLYQDLAGVEEALEVVAV